MDGWIPACQGRKEAGWFFSWCNKGGGEEGRVIKNSREKMEGREGDRGIGFA